MATSIQAHSNKFPELSLQNKARLWGYCERKSMNSLLRIDVFIVSIGVEGGLYQPS